MTVEGPGRQAEGRDAAGVSSHGLSHLDARGRASMVDVGGKEETERVARAGAVVTMAAGTLALIVDQAAPKGDVIAAARLADPNREMPLLIFLAEAGLSMAQMADLINDKLKARGRAVQADHGAAFVGELRERVAAIPA